MPEPASFNAAYITAHVNRKLGASKVQVELSEDRVQEQILRAEIGEGDAFELVRARDALTESRNQLTSALINHTVTRLGFWRDLGLLYILPAGQWEMVHLEDEPPTTP